MIAESVFLPDKSRFMSRRTFWVRRQGWTHIDSHVDSDAQEQSDTPLAAFRDGS